MELVEGIYMSYTVPSVDTKADIIKKIQIEFEHLVYFEYKSKDEAYREATLYVERKYADVIEILRQKGQY